MSSGQEQVIENNVEQPQSKESVAYETHQRLLAQRKRDQEEMRVKQERLDKYEEMERKREQAELESKGQYQKILDEREKKIQDLENKWVSENKRRIDQDKEAAFLQSLPGKLRSQAYLSFMDKEGIAIDPETGKVDEGTVKSVVDKFMKEHPALIEIKQTNTPVNTMSKQAATPNTTINGQPKEIDPLALAGLLLTQKR